MRLLLPGLLLAVSGSVTFTQPTPQPTPVPGTNRIEYDSVSATCSFSVNGSVLYKYEIRSGTANGGTFSVLRAVDGLGGAVTPSLGGGVAAILHGEKKFPWNPDGDIVYACRAVHVEGTTLHALWTMVANNDSLRYEYSFNISGRTLIIRVEEDSLFRNAAELNLGRAEAMEPVTIGVPYLTLCNILQSNNGSFTSMLIDWESTSASTLEPLYDPVSRTTGYFASLARYLERTDRLRNRMREVIYLTVSPDLQDVLPNIPNPPALRKKDSAQRVIWYYPQPMNLCGQYLDSLYSNGIRNLWLQIHDWQKWGSDRGLPDVVPARCNHCDWPDTNCAYTPTTLQGDSLLKEISSRAARYGYLLGLHENYVDYHAPVSSAPNKYYDRKDEALRGDASPFLNWVNRCGDTAHVLKPTRAAFYVDLVAPEIHTRYQTTASYLDVHSAANPSDFVDYDVSSPGAGSFHETLVRYRELPARLRSIHQGPVQGEGHHHFLYTGYFDDIEARLTMAETTTHGYTAPLLVDFDLLKLHSKTLVHGLGNWEQYYNKDFYGWSIGPFSRDSVLSYIATELAYGHGGFLPPTYEPYNFIEAATLTQRYLYEMQLAYADATPVRILYNDNDSLKTASQYIRDHPRTYGEINNPEFMSQVRIEYDNGVVICVNRNLFRRWSVSAGRMDGWFDYHALVSGRDTLAVGSSSQNRFTLPVMNGWVCYIPSGLVPNIRR